MSVNSVDIETLFNQIESKDYKGLDRLSVYTDVVEMTHLLNSYVAGLLKGQYNLSVADGFTIDQLKKLHESTQQAALDFLDIQLNLQEFNIENIKNRGNESDDDSLTYQSVI